ncbi:MAG: efflux RND transporter periplasmic adaptor subunit [Anaerolineales bacterium]|nr:efflux RND transporter periplasmic adaptor subunit [Anaerolineales bacterium]
MYRRSWQKHIARLTLACFILFASACSGSGGGGQASTPTPIPPPAVPVKPTYEVQRGTVSELMEFRAEIVPVESYELYFKVDGRIANVYVEQDDEVTAGQVLADLETVSDMDLRRTRDELAVRRAEIALENAEAAYALEAAESVTPEHVEAEAQLAIAEAQKAVDEAQREYSLSQSGSSDEIDVDAAYAQVVLARNELDKVQKEYEPYANKPADNLTKANLLNKLSTAQSKYEAAVRTYNSLVNASSEVDQSIAEANLSIALANLEAANQAMELLQEGNFEQALTLRENEVELAQIALEEAQLDLQDLEEAIAAAQIVAPIDGVVLQESLTEGAQVQAYSAKLLVGNLNELEIGADLTSNVVIELQEGMAVTVVHATEPSGEFNGTIYQLPYLSSSEDILNQDELVRVKLDAPISETGFELGDRLRVTVIVEKREDVLWLPPQAIRTFEGRRFVVIQDGEVQRRVDIKVGIQGDDRVEIIEGVEAGQVVIGP